MRTNHYQQKVMQASSEGLRSVLLECSGTAKPLFDDIRWILQHECLHNSFLWRHPIRKKACRVLKSILTSDQNILIFPYDPTLAHAIAYMTRWFHEDDRRNLYYSRFYVRHEHFYGLIRLGAFTYDDFLDENWDDWRTWPSYDRMVPSLSNTALVMIEAENADDDLLVELLQQALRLKSLPEVETLRIVLFM